MRPVIGIPCYAAERAGNLRPIFGNNRSYVEAVLRAGGAPVLLPPVGDAEALDAIRTTLDGLLLSGGSDIDPTYYGERALPETDLPDRDRDFTEFTLTRRALEQELPILGICRGMQVLNVALGGTLYQDLPTQVPEAERHNFAPMPGTTIAHTLRVKPGSQFAAIAGTLRPRANSFHHQAVREPGAGVEVVAWTEDGIAEALEAPDYPFVMAVQYHPEALDPSDETSRRLFEAFIEACVERKAHAERAARPLLKVVNE